MNFPVLTVPRRQYRHWGMRRLGAGSDGLDVLGWTGRSVVRSRRGEGCLVPGANSSTAAWRDLADVKPTVKPTPCELPSYCNVLCRRESHNGVCLLDRLIARKHDLKRPTGRHLECWDPPVVSQRLRGEGSPFSKAQGVSDRHANLPSTCSLATAGHPWAPINPHYPQLRKCSRSPCRPSGLGCKILCTPYSRRECLPG